MSLLDEIEGYRAKISAAQNRENSEYRRKNPTSSELPPGFYNPKQLERYHRANSVITSTTEQFMKEIGRPRYRLEREFRITPIPLGARKDMTFLLMLGEKGQEPSEHDVRLPYNPGGRFDLEALSIYYGIPVLVPDHKKNQANFDPAELVAWLSSSEATNVRYPLISLYGEITSQGVKNLLTLIAAKPKSPLQPTVTRSLIG